jgi:hypothetical protein
MTRELSQSTLGLLRKNLLAIESDANVITPYDRRTFWRDELFDFGFATAVIDLFATYKFDWGAIIPDLYVGKFASQSETVLAPLPTIFCERALHQLLAFALHKNKDSGLAHQLREALKRDGLDSAANATPVKEIPQPKASDSQAKQWDVFISHASEDKESIAHPLALALKDRGLQVWYDEFTLTLGDSLRASIDRGLAQSRFGVVILSNHFFAKHWPQQELNGLAAIEVGGRKVILPVWHGVTYEDVVRYSPMLADKKAVSTAEGIDRVVTAILAAVKPDIASGVVYGQTNDLHVGTRVHVRMPQQGVPRESWQFGAEIWVIRKTDEQKKTAVATPVFPPFDGPTPTVEGPMNGPDSPFKRANIGS